VQGAEDFGERLVAVALALDDLEVMAPRSVWHDWIAGSRDVVLSRCREKVPGTYWPSSR